MGADGLAMQVLLPGWGAGAAAASGASSARELAAAGATPAT